MNGIDMKTKTIFIIILSVFVLFVPFLAVIGWEGTPRSDLSLSSSGYQSESEPIDSDSKTGQDSSTDDKADTDEDSSHDSPESESGDKKDSATTSNADKSTSSKVSSNPSASKASSPDTSLSSQPQSGSSRTSSTNTTSSSVSSQSPSMLTIKILDTKSNKIVEVSELDFVRGSVAVEMGPSFSAEALKAQAVASHTYALYYAERGQVISADPTNPDRPIGFAYKETLQKRWGANFNSYWNKICNAVDSIYNEKLVYNGQTALTVFHAMSGGRTEKSNDIWVNGANVPYLISVDSPWDKQADKFNVTVTFTSAEFRDKLSKLGGITFAEDPSAWIGNIVYTGSNIGTIKYITVGGKQITGQQFRNSLGLRSANVEIEYSNNVFRLTTSGYGHGIGMSQVGAEALAKQGKKYDEILYHYFPGTKLVKTG